MRTAGFTISTVAVLIALSICFSACTVTRRTSFNSPNDFKNVKSSVELAGNKKFTGYLCFSRNSQTAVMHSLDFSKAINFNQGDILSIKNDLGYFERKTLRSHPADTQHKSARTAFVKRITDEEDFLHLYRHEEVLSNPKSSLPLTTTRYYAAIPGRTKNEVWDIDAGYFDKDFNKTMEVLFAKDQRLVAMIRQKNDKYSVRKFSIRANNKIRVIMNLNKDYSPQTVSSSAAN
mgnify:FL=1